MASLPWTEAMAAPGASFVAAGPAKAPSYVEVPVAPGTGPSVVEVPVGPPPALSVAPPAPLDPGAPPLSVLVLYRAGSFVGRERAAAIARSLLASGLNLISVEPVRGRLASPHVGFVYDEDRDAASIVAAAAGSAFGLPPPAPLRPADAHTTRPGTVEIAVKG